MKKSLLVVAAALAFLCGGCLHPGHRGVRTVVVTHHHGTDCGHVFLNGAWIVPPGHLKHRRR